MLMTLLVGGLDIMSNSVWRRNFEVGVASSEEVDYLRIGDNRCRAIALSYPLCNVGSDMS
jgi:hypothetical protein